MACNNNDSAGVGQVGNGVDNPQSQPTPPLNQQLIKLNKYLFKDELWPQKYSAILENKLRTMVCQEVDHAVQRFSHSIPGSLPTLGKPADSRQYALHFEGKLPRQLFTGNKVVAEGYAPLKVLLLDAVSGLRIEDGPLSSKKIEIVALHGHFKAEQLEEWTKREFCRNIVTERDNKKPLLVGQRVIALRNGVGLIDDVCFTDNSCWERSKMFRIGAKLVTEEDTVREAVSSPFQVKDRRGEAYQKHCIPSPDDEVWRLCWIAKKGKIHKRLEGHQIHKVKDLVTLYHSDQSLLHHLLKVTPKKWNEIIQQATSCFTENDCTNLTAYLAQVQIPIDQQEIQMSETHVDAAEHLNQLDKFVAVEELLTASSNNANITSLDYTMPSLSATMFNDESTSWLPGPSASALNDPRTGLGNIV